MEDTRLAFADTNQNDVAPKTERVEVPDNPTVPVDIGPNRKTPSSLSSLKRTIFEHPNFRIRPKPRPDNFKRGFLYYNPPNEPYENILNSEQSERKENNETLIESQDFTIREDVGCFKITKPSKFISKQSNSKSSKGYEIRDVSSGRLSSNHTFIRGSFINTKSEYNRVDNRILQKQKTNEELKTSDNKEEFQKGEIWKTIFRLNRYKADLYGNGGRNSARNETLNKKEIYKEYEDKDYAYTSTDSKDFVATSKFKNDTRKNGQETQGGDLKLDYQENENKLETSVASNGPLQVQNNTLVFEEKNKSKENDLKNGKRETKSTKKYTSITISESIHDARRQENGQLTKIYQRKEKISNKQYSVKTKNCNKNVNSYLENLKKGQDIQNYYENYVNWANSNWGTPIENSLNTYYPFFYPQYPTSQMYWPYSGYFSPDQLYWWYSLQPAYQIPDEISTADTPQLTGATPTCYLPYTGVAGYNWPTIRKPLKSVTTEEKSYLPVYVKPPLVGNEETEQIRTAYLKHIKQLKYIIFRRCVRKRKQLERRERNHKIRLASKLAIPGNKVPEPEEQDENSSSEINTDSDDSAVSENPQEIRYRSNEKRTKAVSTNTPLPLEASTRNGSLPTGSVENDQNNSMEDRKASENSFESLVNLATDSFEISEQDFAQKTSSNVTNNLEDVANVKSIHPICGPVCYRKEALLDAYLSSKIPQEFKK